MIRWSSALIVLILLAGCSTVPSSFDPEQPIPVETFSHRDFEAVLGAHVEDGQVDYPGIVGDPRFDAYLDQLNRVNPNDLTTREDRLAFWINAYNAFAIKGIVDGYSPSTTFGRYRYFIGREYAIGGREINLYDLERKLLIPDFREPRIHFAIVCASRSCPKLDSTAYVTEALEQRLDESAKRFINDPSKNRFDRERKVAYLSKIFDWFEEDFVAHSGSLLDYVGRYLEDQELAQDLRDSSYTVEFLEYDWHLNGIPPTSEVRHARID